MKKAPKGKQSLRLSALRRKLTADQKKLLDTFWHHFHASNEWPITRVIHSRNGGKENVKSRLRALEFAGDVVSEMYDNSCYYRYELRLLGILQTKNGEDYERLLIQYLTFLRDQYLVAPEIVDFSEKELTTGLELAATELTLLRTLITLSGFLGNISGSAVSWSVRVPPEIEDMPRKGPVAGMFETLLFRWVQAGRPVFLEDKRNQNLKVHPTPFETVKQEEPILHTSVDALKRRYQVFVSSTYEDLKEERQQVIQALLETKCIPLGMELFPAASIQQWELIKRVIADCDYYVVVVAGRYGSLGEAGISYTEMEFDYAIEMGKPILGFVHVNPENLIGSRLEKRDAGKEKLKLFVGKVKKRLCRHWDSPAALGSAVKSAIVSELEFNPKPGWVRADAMPPSEAVQKLKQKIADLEERLKRKGTGVKTEFPSGIDLLELTVTIDFYSESDSGTKFAGMPSKTTDHTFQITWDDLVRIIGTYLTRGATTGVLGPGLAREIGKLHMDEIQRLIEPSTDYGCRLETETVTRILKTLMARRLIKMVPRFSGSFEDPTWRFTPSGVQYLAELEAMRKET